MSRNSAAVTHSSAVYSINLLENNSFFVYFMFKVRGFIRMFV